MQYILYFSFRVDPDQAPKLKIKNYSPIPINLAHVFSESYLYLYRELRDQCQGEWSNKVTKMNSMSRSLGTGVLQRGYRGTLSVSTLNSNSVST